MIIEFLKYPVTIVLSVCLGKYIFNRIKTKLAMNKLEELSDCPFKFTVAFEDADDYIVFQLGNGSTLWCEYGFGIRCDGVYGVSDLKLKNLNGMRNGPLRLPIGQSVFPLIEKMEQFEDWAKKKTLEYEWDNNFEEVWDEMKKKLDNLRFLETKSIEKEKKKNK